MEIAFIDHYDSFSFNVLDWLRSAAQDKDVQIRRITSGDEAALARLKYSPIPVVISPGPGRPKDYPRSVDAIKILMNKVPVLGICLGHQMIAEIAGGEIVRASNPWHGTASTIHVSARNWFTEHLPDRFEAVCYNSLVVKAESIAEEDWEILGTNQNEEVMIMTHRTKPIASVQFHPESFASECGTSMAKNFLRMALS